MTSQQCTLQIKVKKDKAGFQMDFTVWKANGTKMTASHQSFETEKQLINYIVAEKYPEPPKPPPGTILLTNLPAAQAQSNRGLK